MPAWIRKGSATRADERPTEGDDFWVEIVSAANARDEKYEVAALAFADSYWQMEGEAADLIPDAIWERLYADKLIVQEFDQTGEATTSLTDKGKARLLALLSTNPDAKGHHPEEGA